MAPYALYSGQDWASYESGNAKKPLPFNILSDKEFEKINHRPFSPSSVHHVEEITDAEAEKLKVA
jgi:hypothetical protein